MKETKDYSKYTCCLPCTLVSGALICSITVVYGIGVVILFPFIYIGKHIYGFRCNKHVEPHEI